MLSSEAMIAAKLGRSSGSPDMHASASSCSAGFGDQSRRLLSAAFISAHRDPRNDFRGAWLSGIVQRVGLVCAFVRSVAVEYSATSGLGMCLCEVIAEGRTWSDLP